MSARIIPFGRAEGPHRFVGMQRVRQEAKLAEDLRNENAHHQRVWAEWQRLLRCLGVPTLTELGYEWPGTTRSLFLPDQNRSIVIEFKIAGVLVPGSDQAIEALWCMQECAQSEPPVPMLPASLELLLSDIEEATVEYVIDQASSNSPPCSSSLLRPVDVAVGADVAALAVANNGDFRGRTAQQICHALSLTSWLSLPQTQA